MIVPNKVFAGACECRTFVKQKNETPETRNSLLTPWYCNLLYESDLEVFFPWGVNHLEAKLVQKHSRTTSSPTKNPKKNTHPVVCNSGAPKQTKNGNQVGYSVIHQQIQQFDGAFCAKHPSGQME